MCDKNCEKMSTCGRKAGKVAVKAPSHESSPEESLSHSLSSLTLEALSGFLQTIHAG